MKKTVFACALGLLPMMPAVARDYVSVVGSSTVFPFSAVVAEFFGKESEFKTPKIEATGSGGGIKLFCTGTGVHTPDVVNASRRMKSSELTTCEENGVTSVTEVLIGFDGIAVANSKEAKPFDLTIKQLFNALAKSVPAPDGSEKLVPNPYYKWSDIDARLPHTAIEVLGPPPSSGTREAFTELVLESGCEQYEWLKAMKKSDKKQFKTICHAMREDGVYIEAGENDNLIIQKLRANSNALGIFGYSFLEQNTDTVQGAIIDGLAPNFETIATGQYPISRPLYFYVKNAHLDKIPGVKPYAERFVSEEMIGDEGILLDFGLIPLDKARRDNMRHAVRIGQHVTQ